MERLAKYLAHCGIASRRKAEEYIKEGQVSVNGAIVESPATNIDPSKDHIKIGNKLIKPKTRKYFILNKPKNVITTKADTFDRQTVLDLLPAKHHDLHPVGRLDKDTTGLLLLTNDGPLTNALTHPRYHAQKRYRVTINGKISLDDVIKIKKGVWLAEGKTKPAKARIVRSGRQITIVDVSIREGKNRQIRRMISSIGYRVKDLERISIGPISLGRLAIGQWRVLSGSEIKRLKEYVDEVSQA
jgi:23S rRNA pseudouridine2605 synthase